MEGLCPGVMPVRAGGTERDRWVGSGELQLYPRIHDQIGSARGRRLIGEGNRGEASSLASISHQTMTFTTAVKRQADCPINSTFNLAANYLAFAAILHISITVKLRATIGVYFIGFYLIFNYQMTANLAHGIRTGYIVLGIHDFGDTEAKKVARRVLVLDRQMPAGTKCLRMLWCYVRSWRSGSRGPSKAVERFIAG